MKKYYLFETGVAGGNTYKRYTLEELKEFFTPDPETADEDELDDFNAIETVENLIDYIENHVNNCDGVHYHDYVIEEA